ncbi:MAG: threonine/serine exporter family protein [Paludibacter sp.]|nr:threonine/serine exporter family protein [Paludibacter sp.]
MTDNPFNQEPTIEQTAVLLIDIASALMSSGAHTMRIIQNVSRMAETFGYELDLSVFQLSIMMTIINKENPGKLLTQVKKIKPLHLNFTIVSELSALSWETYDKHLPYDAVRSDYHKIISKKRMNSWLVLFLVSAANASFCGLFKGDFTAMAFVFFATFIGFSVRQEMMKKHINHLVTFTSSAFVASLLAGMGYVLHVGHTPEIALASSVLYLIPGVPLINSILDILQGHILTGIARLVNAVSLIVCIAIGLFTSMLILGLEKL